MALANFLELRAAVADYTVRSDLPMGTLITMAESKFASTVKHRLAEKYVYIEVGKEVAAFPLPKDFLEARSIRLNDCLLTLASITNASSEQPTSNFYHIVGNDIHLGRKPSADPGNLLLLENGDWIELVEGGFVNLNEPVLHDVCAFNYYARVPALTEAAPTNWLLSTFPDVYLYAVLVEYAIWAQDTDKQASYAALLGVALGNLAADHARGSFSGSTLQTRRFA